MKIFSWNVNGLRAAAKKGFLNWLKKSQAETVCLQEIKAQPEQLSPALTQPPNYFSFFHPAFKKGYSGLAVYTKQKPLSTKRRINFHPFDQEGRFLQLNYPQLTLINLYLPHGQRDKGKLAYKLKAYQKILAYLRGIKNEKIILAGDFNIAHQEIDLARPKQNLNNIMFTPQERKQLDKLQSLGFTDVFRHLHPQKQTFTWWPYTYQARERNLGWRLDYLFSSPKLTPKIKKAFIQTNTKGSDHCPLGIELNAKFT